MTGAGVAVVGGSIGGLTAALLLRDAGWDVDVFERSSAPLEGRGAGIVLHPSTVRYLVERTGASVEEISTPAGWFRYLARDGSVAHEQPCRYRFTSYNAIYGRLLAAFGGERYHLGEECVEVGTEDGRGRASFASGRSERRDLVVCADGINSVGRRLLAPGAEPRYARYVAWRGTVGEAELGAGFGALADSIIYCVEPGGGHFLAYPIPGSDGSVEPGRRLANWLWYRNVASDDQLAELLTGRDGTRFATSLPPGLVPEERLRELRDDAAAALPPALVEALAQTPDPFIQVIFDVEVERTVHGRVCLAGDAAFTARPHIAVGTAKAAEDAWTLAAAVGDGRDGLDGALARWEREQVALGKRAVARACEAGERLQLGAWQIGEPLPFGLRRPGDSSFAT